MEKDSTSTAINSTGPEQDMNTTILHVYHFNKEESKHYAIHTLCDSSTPIVLPKKRSKKKSKKSTKRNETPDNECPAEASNDEKAPRDPPPPTTRWQRMCLKAAREKVFDKAKHDPRANPEVVHPNCESYFLHHPVLFGHMPPYTLRQGGHKRAPVTALIQPIFFWRKWKLEFGDVLKQDGIIDGRGIVNWRAGTTNGEGGTLKGYPDRKRRWWLESGKKYFYEEKENGHTIPEAINKARPEEVVDVKWTSPLTRAREYNFTWRGFDFAWKGTGVINHQPQVCRIFRLAATRYNHLKLVVVVPQRKGQLGEKDSDTGTQEFVLARYTSILAKRKAGRLEIFHDMTDQFLSDNDVVLSPPAALPIAVESPVEKPVMEINEKSSLEGKVDPFQDRINPSCEFKREQTQQRLKDLIVASGMCMIVGEYEKRATLCALFWLAVDIAQNAG